MICSILCLCFIKIKKVSVRRQDSEMANSAILTSNSAKDDITGYDEVKQNDEENKDHPEESPVHAIG